MMDLYPLIEGTFQNRYNLRLKRIDEFPTLKELARLLERNLEDLTNEIKISPTLHGVQIDDKPILVHPDSYVYVLKKKYTRLMKLARRQKARNSRNSKPSS